MNTLSEEPAPEYLPFRHGGPPGQILQPNTPPTPATYRLHQST